MSLPIGSRLWWNSTTSWATSDSADSRLAIG
jgi:hypothetical protein